MLCAGGWWGQRFGGRNDLDLGYLRNVNLSRGLFSTPYRNVYNRFNENLGARYSPYIPQSRLRGLGGVGRVGGLGGGLSMDEDRWDTAEKWGIELEEDRWGMLERATELGGRALARDLSRAPG